MEHSSFSLPEKTAKLASGHNEVGEPQSPTGNPAENAGASLHTTASDYARFLAACLNELNKKNPIFAEFMRAIVPMTEDKTAVKKGVDNQVLGSVAWTLGWGFAEVRTRRHFISLG